LFRCFNRPEYTENTQLAKNRRFTHLPGFRRTNGASLCDFVNEIPTQRVQLPPSEKHPGPFSNLLPAHEVRLDPIARSQEVAHILGTGIRTTRKVKVRTSNPVLKSPIFIGDAHIKGL